MKKKRCPWVPIGNTLYETYHDKEWGVPVYDDRVLFEFLVLESAQAGLSWITVLKKREAYRELFKDFDPKKVARFGKKEVKKLLQDTRIIRNKQKIEAAITNAKQFLLIQKEFGTFAAYQWSFVGGRQKQNKLRKKEDYVAITKEAEAFAKDLKARGFKFLGPTVIYAHMQATGMVNDHTMSCFRYEQIKKKGGSRKAL